MSAPIRIFIAEDHPIVRRGLRELISSMPGMNVVGECGDGAEVIKLVLELDPDVLLLDVGLPNQDGIEIVKNLTKKRSRAQVLMLSMHEQEDYVLKALRSGATGYMLKSADIEEMQVAIRSVVAGHRYLSMPLSQRAIAAYSAGAQDVPLASEAEEDRYSALTSRQREVLRLMADGYGNNQIGTQLGISPRTAELHRAHIMQRLKLTSQRDVVRYAVQRGLVSLGK